jgi:hypothetical protein
MKTNIQRVTAKPLTPAQESRLDREVRALATLSTEVLQDRARPLTPTENAQWERARRGRPKKPIGRKAARVLFTIEPELLEKADRYAREHGLTRAQLIANGLRTVLSA